MVRSSSSAHEHYVIPYIVDAATAISIVWALNIISAHVRSFGTDSIVSKASAFPVSAIFNLIETSTDHVGSKLHIAVHSIVHGLDAVCVVYCEFGIIWGLSILVDNAVTNLHNS